MFDLPPPTPVSFGEPVTAHEAIIEQRDPVNLPLTITPDVGIVSGGTAVMLGTGTAADGGLLAPWNGSVTHADRLLGATRGAFTVHL